jgi:peptidoglycan/LPS O-acetylase OafA/YrhL
MGNRLSVSFQPSVGHRNYLDPLLALRGFACFMVVVFHCAPPRNAIFYRGYDFSWIFFSHGLVAVWIFFVLSGYLMGKAFYTERYTNDISGAINFWHNRALRIFPLYYFAVLFLTVFVYPELLKIENWGYLIRVCTFTYHGSPPLQSKLNFNGALWSLSTEVQFYLLVPFIYNCFQHHLGKKRQVFWAFFLMFLLVSILRGICWLAFRNEITNIFYYAFKYWYAPLWNNLDLFLCGFLVNALLKYKNTDYQEDWNWKIIKKIALILIFLLYLFTAHHLYYQELFNSPERLGKGFRTTTTIFILPVVTAMVVSFLIFAWEYYEYHTWIKNEKLSFHAILKNPLRILEIFGNLSYGIYIWHVPIIEKFTPIFTSPIPVEAFYQRLTATLLTSIVLASISYYLIELPWAKNKIYRPKENF